MHARARLKSGTGLHPKFGGHSGGDTPLPIPNREVKPTCADGTRRATSRESRQPPTSFGGPRKRPFSFSGGPGLLAPAGIERAEAPHALRDRRMSREQRGQAFLGERVDRVQRLGRRTALEMDELV